MGTPEPEPQTLAAGELVWAKTKGRQHWWPARLRAACPAGAAIKDVPVSCFGDGDEERLATRLRRFADPAADKMARAGTARGFLSAVEVAHAAAVALLCTGLTCACACASPPTPPPAAEGAVVVGNLSPSEFVASLRRAALDAPAVGLVDRARLKSWARALAQGWGPAGAGRYQRRTVEELVDKIDLDDLNEPAGEEGDAAADEDSDKPPKTPAQRRRPLKDASLAEETDAGLSTGRMRKKSKYLSPPYTNLSSSVLDEKLADRPKESLPSASKQEKKVLRDNVDAREVLELVRSFGAGISNESQFPKAAERFLGLHRSSTFAGVNVAAALVSDSGAALKLGKSVLERSRKKDEAGVGGSSSKRKKKMEKTSPTATLDFPAENVVAKDNVDVAALVSDSSAALKKGKGVRKRSTKKDQDGSGGASIKRKKVEKTSTTKEATPKLLEENVSANASADGAGLVPHSCATLEQGKAVMKRGRKKKDQDASGGTPIKRKRMKKTSPTAILDTGLVITPAIPIRQVRAEDMISQVRSGGGAGMGVGVLDHNKLAFRSPISAAMSGRLKSGEEQDQANGGSVVKAPVTGEATKPGTDRNVESVVADLPARSVQAEEAKPGMGIQVDMNVQSGIVNVPIRTVQMEAMELETNIPVGTNGQAGVTDLPVRSGLLPKDGGISQPADGNTNNVNVEMRTVQGAVSDERVRSGLLPKHGGISQPADGNTHTANVEVQTVQGVVPDVPVRSGLLPKNGGISQPTDGNTNDLNVEVRTVQESYASLEAMVPEMYKKVDDITTGIKVTGTGPAFKDEGPKGEQTSQKKTAGEAIAKHAPAISSNGTSSGPPNSTPKRRNKKAAQHFANPAEILLEFIDGVILPSKEELLSAFIKFGNLIESVSDILEDIRGARVVFGKSAEAEAAYTKRETPGIFGQFGPPFATLKRLNYLPPFTPITPPPAPALKPPLGVADMRKNVENMISSLAGKKAAGTSSSAGASPVPEYLLGEMQRLLSKLDNIQAGPSSSARAPP